MEHDNTVVNKNLLLILIIPILLQIACFSEHESNEQLTYNKNINKAEIDILLEKLESSDLGDRKTAAKALGNYGDKSTVQALITALDDKEWEVRVYAAHSLGKIKDKSAVPALRESLDDNALTVRVSSAVALFEIGDTSGIPTLINALEEGKEKPYILTVVLSELGRTKRYEAVLAIVETIRIKNIDSNVREAGLIALGNIGNEPAVSFLIDFLIDRENSFYDRCIAAESLGNTKDENAVAALIIASKDKNKLLRKTAIDALGEIGDETAIPTLEKALNDEWKPIVDAAMRALNKIDKQRNKLQPKH
jgi:HEAT repeat protein